MGSIWIWNCADDIEAHGIRSTLENARIPCALVENTRGDLQIIVEDPAAIEEARILHGKIAAVYARRVDASLGLQLKQRNKSGAIVLVTLATVLLAGLMIVGCCGF